MSVSRWWGRRPPSHWRSPGDWRSGHGSWPQYVGQNAPQMASRLAQFLRSPASGEGRREEERRGEERRGEGSRKTTQRGGENWSADSKEGSKETCAEEEDNGEGNSGNGGKGRRNSITWINTEINKSWYNKMFKEAFSIPVSQGPERKAFVCHHSCWSYWAGLFLWRTENTHSTRMWVQSNNMSGKRLEIDLF